MKFKNEQHQNLFNKLLSKIGTWATKDKEYCSACFALAATEKQNVFKYVDHEGIDFDQLLKDSKLWSSGERALVKLAATLFNSQGFPLTVQEVFYSLDHENTQAALKAIGIRYN
ncbi:hypothetical protein [Desulforamulus reducens]|nr:hypothetical protein [Desulforamulus reducens]